MGFNDKERVIILKKSKTFPFVAFDRVEYQDKEEFQRKVEETKKRLGDYENRR